ncbi:membrane protein [Alcanivorax sp. 97CO-5]|jgi:sulfite exporter TauE/SafE|uniref:sulfite exporter TauE/SafE family protein n=1 Tax=unclassified Alcanivorax TaxID=2638842 RepID=UPI0003E7E9CD|nr:MULTISPECIES: sulfite exporter TauE/SafE family protein [unclassified Alcanivorax]EUC71220.1 membrane protein [Alcanivorax sp. 97CO-5]
MTIDTLIPLIASASLIASAGSVHCIGMCGGISSALTFSIPESRRQGVALWGWQLLFGLGRVTTYCVLGALAGALGGLFLGQLPGPSMSVGLILSGVLMLLLSAYLLGKGAFLQRIEKIGQRLWRSLQPITRKLMPIDHPVKALMLGSLWGFLPCGLIYTALALAATGGTAVAGALVMLCFGVITVVPVAITGVLASQLQRFRKGAWPMIASALTFCLALVFFWQAWLMAQHGHSGHSGHSMPGPSTEAGASEHHHDHHLHP